MKEISTSEITYLTNRYTIKINNKNILLISPEPWNHIFVSKHHYAINLAERGNQVFFLNPPSHKVKVEDTKFKNLYSVHYRGFPIGLRYYPNFLQVLLISRTYFFLQKACSVVFDVIWSFDNSVFYDFSALPKSLLKISHIVDLNQDFQTTKAARTADICFGTTRSIINRLKIFQANSFLIQHGYNTRFISSPDLVLPGHNILKVAYAGNLDIPYLAWETLNKIISENPKVDFVFAGKMESKKPAFSHPNAYYLGVLQANQLNDFYKKSDLLILCYKADQYPEQLANPHKMMDYLGSGKAVVATKTLEYKNLADQGLIAMSDSDSDFPDLFSDVLIDLKHWNEDGKCKRRMVFADSNSYVAQIQRIESLIGSLEKKSL